MTQPDPTPPADRKAFDKLLRERATAMRTSARKGRPDAANADEDTATEVKVLEEGAKVFADAVDRELGKHGYDEVVFIRGDKGTKVVLREDYYRSPDYYRTGLGVIDFEQDGESLLHYLRTGQQWQPRP